MTNDRWKPNEVVFFSSKVFFIQFDTITFDETDKTKLLCWSSQWCRTTPNMDFGWSGSKCSLSWTSLRDVRSFSHRHSIFAWRTEALFYKSFMTWCNSRICKRIGLTTWLILRPLKKVGGPMAKTLHDFYETLMPIKKVFFIWVEFLKRVFRAEISIWKRPAKQNWWNQ